MFGRAIDDKPSDTLVVVSGEGFWTGSSTLPHLHHFFPLPAAYRGTAALLRRLLPADTPSRPPLGVRPIAARAAVCHGEPEMIKWEDTMTTGVDTIDAQHKQLIAWLNDLLAAMSEGKGRGEIEKVLNDLGSYAGTHFAHEEGCMAKYQCPVAAQNIEAHKQFVQTFGAFKAEFDRTGPTPSLVIQTKSELMSWLTNHIKGTDTQLAPCVRAAGK
jgi:hemerythrin